MTSINGLLHGSAVGWADMMISFSRNSGSLSDVGCVSKTPTPRSYMIMHHDENCTSHSGCKKYHLNILLVLIDVFNIHLLAFLIVLCQILHKLHVCSFYLREEGGHSGKD